MPNAAMTPLFVYMTVGSRAEAETIGRRLVEERLAACTNILDNMTSFYWWEGKLVEDREVVLIAKTVEERLERLVERVKALHSYTCPCVVALPIVGGNARYLNWVRDETAEKV